LLGDLGVTKSHSRPHVSDDNPFSEAQFKTLKYRPDFPGRFGSFDDGLSLCRAFFTWYNQEHRHSGIGMLTPEMVHYGLAEEVLKKRQQILKAAYQTHPDRFVRGVPRPQGLPAEVWINPPPNRSPMDRRRVELVTPFHKEMESGTQTAHCVGANYEEATLEVLQ
jgi:putative transposase